MRSSFFILLLPLFGFAAVKAAGRFSRPRPAIQLETAP